MKQYGNNLPSNCQQVEIEEYHGRTINVMLAGCAVRNDMLAYIQSEGDPPKRKPLNIISFLKLGRKKPQENGN